MEQIIKVDVLEESELIEKYDSDKINKNLIEYVIKEAKYIKEDEKLKIVINNKCNTKVDIANKLIEGLKYEYQNILKEYYRNNIIQLILLVIGIIFIFLSSLIDESIIWKEVILIIGWVPIWEMVDLELFKDYRGRKRKRIIARLLTSKMVENKIR